jgi:DNA repair exonuclease SbcCD ATPase subunit
MAVRSGAGTGVIVSLVVFIVTTFMLLVLAIVFYSKQTKAAEAEATAQKTLETYIRSPERSQDTFKQYEDAARSSNKSVAGYLHGQMTDVMQFVDGAPGTQLPQLQASVTQYGVAADGTIRSALQDLSRSVGDRDDEIERLKSQLRTRDDELAQAEAQMTQLRDSHQQQVDATEVQIAQYRESVMQYRQEVDDVKRAMQEQTTSSRRRSDRASSPCRTRRGWSTARSSAPRRTTTSTSIAAGSTTSCWA